MRRGEIWTANLNPNKGGEIGKVRPVVVLQEDRLIAGGLPTILSVSLTTQFRPIYAPLRVIVPARDRLLRDCYVMIEHLRALDRSRFGEGPLAYGRPASPGSELGDWCTRNENAAHA